MLDRTNKRKFLEISYDDLVSGNFEYENDMPFTKDEFITFFTGMYAKYPEGFTDKELETEIENHLLGLTIAEIYKLEEYGIDLNDLTAQDVLNQYKSDLKWNDNTKYCFRSVMDCKNCNLAKIINPLECKIPLVVKELRLFEVEIENEE